jgi:hypothetical protein
MSIEDTNHIPLLPMAETSFLTRKWKRMNITTMWSDGQLQTFQRNVQSAAKTNRMHSVILTPYVYSNCGLFNDAISDLDCTVSDGGMTNK